MAPTGRDPVEEMQSMTTRSDVSVTRLAEGLDQPILAVPVPDATERLFIVERPGTIRLLDTGTGVLRETPVLDLSDEVATEGERGLLGLAFSPDDAEDGTFYVHLSNPAGDSEIRRYTVTPGEPARADPASADVLLRVEQPFSNHNGGFIGFGPEGLLHVALGDGGGAPSASPDGPSQDPDSLLGKVLRLDVSGDAFPDDPARDYRIPPGNPFADGGGAPEVWALGLRNPFRASFDPATGDLYIGDVGEDRFEEVNVIRSGEAGVNFGWNRFEGTADFLADATTQDEAGVRPPVLQYAHGDGPLEGSSITGGVVYRGPIAALADHYVFGDFISGNIWSVPVASLSEGATLTAESLTRLTDAFAPDAGTIDLVSSFAATADGRLVITDLDGEVFQIAPSGAAIDLLGDFGIPEQLSAIYLGYFGRAPDPAGLGFWAADYQSRLAAGQEAGPVLDAIAESFRLSAEARALFPVLDPESAASADPAEIAAFVEAVYENLFNRPPGPEGRDFWGDLLAQRLQAGGGVGDIVLDIASGARDGGAVDLDGDGGAEAVDDATAVANRIAAADDYAARIGDRFTPSDARAVIAEVGSDPASLAAARARIDDLVSMGLAAPTEGADLL